VPKGVTLGERHPEMSLIGLRAARTGPDGFLSELNRCGGLLRRSAPYPAAAALSALGTVSFGDTLYQASRIRPSSPIRNDERMIPMYLRP
jgi:hypothetical protein